MRDKLIEDIRGVRTTAQFSSKIFSKESGKQHLWASDNLSNFTFSQDKQNFKTSNCSLDLSEDGKSYHVKSNTNKTAIVDVTWTQAAPGFVIGKNGNTYFGTDKTQPWGRMRHAFWPRCRVEGSIMTKDGPFDLKGQGIFIHALQGMKPHFAGKSANRSAATLSDLFQPQDGISPVSRGPPTLPL